MTLRKCLGIMMLLVSCDILFAQAILPKVSISSPTAGNQTLLRLHSPASATRQFSLTGVAPGIRFGDGNSDTDDDASIGMATVTGQWISSAAINDLIMRNMTQSGKLLFGTWPSGGSALLERMRINGDGKIGMGSYMLASYNGNVIPNPEASLHIVSSYSQANPSAYFPALKLQNAGTGLGGKVGIEFQPWSALNGTMAKIEAYDLDACKAAITFSTVNGDGGSGCSATSPSERMRINSNGNVGIGDFTSIAPSNPLTIRQTVPSISLTSTSAPTSATAFFDFNGAYSIGYSSSATCGSGWLTVGGVGSSSLRTFYNNNGKIVFGNSNAIGNACSGVAGLSGDYLFDGQASAKTLLVAAPSTTAPTIPSGYIFTALGNANVRGSLVVHSGGTPTSSSGNITISDALEKSTIQTTGKSLALNPNGNFVSIGYGTGAATQPGDALAADYKLRVNGKIICEELKVQLKGTWPDYVFDKNYKLASLDSVEAFIEENQHLPEVPSAKEVAENGIATGEMNAILLRKVEELTLYMIQQQKAMADQQKEIEALKKQLTK